MSSLVVLAHCAVLIGVMLYSEPSTGVAKLHDYWWNRQWQNSKDKVAAGKGTGHGYQTPKDTTEMTLDVFGEIIENKATEENAGGLILRPSEDEEEPLEIPQYSQLSTNIDPLELNVINKNVNRDLYISPEYVRIISRIRLETELIFYALEFSAEIADELIRIEVLQDNKHPLPLSQPLVMDDKTHYFVKLLPAGEKTETGLYDMKLIVEVYLHNPIGRLTINNHEEFRRRFAFKSPYSTINHMANIRRVDTLSPLKMLPEQSDDEDENKKKEARSYNTNP